MSLYRYVPGKAELLDLMLDRVLGEPLPSGTDPADAPAPPADWRASIDAMARTYLDNLRRHPWLLKINQARTVLGPSALRGLELSLTALRSMGLRDPELISVIITVNSFVEGLARTRADAAEAVRETGLSDQEFWDGQRPYLERAMLSGAYPMMASLSEDTFSTEFDHFEFGLRRLIMRLRGPGRGADGGRNGGPGHGTDHRTDLGTDSGPEVTAPPARAPMDIWTPAGSSLLSSSSTPSC